MSVIDPDGSSALLTCRGVEVAYDGVQVLFGVDLEVHAGEVVALLGTNGAGKSTLLRAVSQLVRPIGGQITLDGQDLTTAGPLAVVAAGVVHVPGGRAVFPTLSVAEHFAATRWSTPVTEETTERQRRVLDRFPRLLERWGQRAGDLSGGEQQQLALATAFVSKPLLLIIDELSLGLAPKVVEELLGLVRELNAEGTAVLLVEQSVNVALTVAQRAIFLEKGEVRFTGPTEDLLGRDDVLRSVFIKGAAAGVPRRADARSSATATPVDDAAAPALSTRGLHRQFGGVVAVDDVSFDVSSGSIVGLIGPNGAGKTTTFDLISGGLAADFGTVWLEEQEVTDWTPSRRARAGLGRSFQDARIFPSLTVEENLALGLDRHLTDRDHVASLFALPAVREVEVHVSYTVDDLVELMRLGSYRDKLAGELSTGTRRVVDLAMIIGHDPRVLLLDEPSSGIAQRETEALAPLLLRIQRETGCAMVVIEHDMPLITSISHELIAFDLGRIISRGRPEDVLKDDKVLRSYLGDDARIVQRSGARKGTGSRPRAKKAVAS